MVLYQGPGKERATFSSKFIRVEDQIFVTKPRDTDTEHKDLAEQDGITERIKELWGSNSQELDAGLMSVAPGNKNIIVTGDSYSLHLPIERVARKARKKTVEVLMEQAKGYSVNSR